MEEKRDTIMENSVKKIRDGLREGMNLPKCRTCTCMKEALESMHSALPLLQGEESLDLLEDIEAWLGQMKHVTPPCNRCDPCFPAAAMDMLNQLIPGDAEVQSSVCDIGPFEQTVPPAAEGRPDCGGTACLVGVSTLASAELAEDLASQGVKELCMVGKTETENLGVDTLVKNMVANPQVRVLLVVGKDPEGHYSGKTLLALHENGIDENMKVIDSPGRRPILSNATREEVDAFRRRVQVVDMIGCENVEQIIEKVKELSIKAASSNNCDECRAWTAPMRGPVPPVIMAKEHLNIKMDSAGYFIIEPQRTEGTIVVEHYSYDNKRKRVIKGKDASSIYQTIIENGWVTQMSHAAYLGKELASAELSLKQGFRYIQDDI